MKLAALILYGVAFLLQLAGAWGVIRDARTGIRNMGQFKVDLAAADDKADEHREVLRTRGHDLIRRADASQREAWVWQVGPAGKLQRDAVLNYVNAQNDISNRRRWTAVSLLVGGLVLGFVGNMLSLYPW